MADVIADFLVSLGYKLDPNQQAKFDAMLKGHTAQAATLSQSLQGVANQLNQLGQQFNNLANNPNLTKPHQNIINQNDKLETSLKRLGWTAAATVSTIVTGFLDIARANDHLFYTQQRTGLSGAALSGLQYAGTQAGVGKEGLVNAAEALATSARNPGLASILRGFGVAIGPNGQLGDQALDQFMQRMAKLPPFMQDIYAGMFGINQTTMRNYINNMDRIHKRTAEWQQLLKESGVNYDKFIGHANEVTTGFERIWSKLNLIMVQAFEEAFPAADKLMHKLDEFLDWTIKFNASNPGAALIEGMIAATAAATSLLAVLQKISGIPFLNYIFRALNTAAGGAGAAAGALAGEVAANPGAYPYLKPVDPYSDPYANPQYKPGMKMGDFIKNAPHYAEGGIVPINAHAGEIVLPQSLSSMLLGIAGGGGGFLGGFTSAFQSWIQGGTGYVPYVKIYGLNQDGSTNSGSWGGTSTGGGGQSTGGAPGRFGGMGPRGSGGGTFGSGGSAGVSGTPVHGQMSAQQIYQLAREVGFDDAGARTMAGIAMAESGGNPLNVNTNYRTDPGGSYGLTQINAKAHPTMMNPDVYDARANLRYAYEISNGGRNFTPWTTYRTGAFQQYVPSGSISAGDTGNPNGTETGSGGWGTADHSVKWNGNIAPANPSGFRPDTWPTEYGMSSNPDYGRGGAGDPGGDIDPKTGEHITRINRNLDGKQSSNVTHNYDGDRTVHVAQNNHFHGSGMPDGGAIKELNRHAGLLSRNVQTNIV